MKLMKEPAWDLVRPRSFTWVYSLQQFHDTRLIYGYICHWGITRAWQVCIISYGVILSEDWSKLGVRILAFYLGSKWFWPASLRGVTPADSERWDLTYRQKGLWEWFSSPSDRILFRYWFLALLRRVFVSWWNFLYDSLAALRDLLEAFNLFQRLYRLCLRRHLRFSSQLSHGWSFLNLENLDGTCFFKTLFKCCSILSHCSSTDMSLASAHNWS